MCRAASDDVHAIAVDPVVADDGVGGPSPHRQDSIGSLIEPLLATFPTLPLPYRVRQHPLVAYLQRLSQRHIQEEHKRKFDVDGCRGADLEDRV